MTMRVHRNGYHIEWYKNFTKDKVADSQLSEEKRQLKIKKSNESEKDSIPYFDLANDELEVLQALDPIFQSDTTFKATTQKNSEYENVTFIETRIDSSEPRQLFTDNDDFKQYESQKRPENKTNKPNGSVKKVLLGLLFFSLMLILSTIIVSHFLGIWIIASAGLLAWICIGWLTFALYAGGFIISEVSNSDIKNLHLGYRISYELMRWTLWILYGAFCISLGALLIYGVFMLILTALAVVSEIILY
jgi:hypothetical protein